jgi:STE24 endopeptidase
LNPFLWIILLALAARFVLVTSSDLLNLKHLRPVPPDDLADIYHPDRYRVSQQYLRDNTRYDLVARAFDLSVVLAMMFAGGFNWVDGMARSAGFGPIGTGLLFGGLLLVGSKLLHLPFSLYHTFALEEQYDFNRTTPRTFAADWIKELLLTAAIGGILFAVVLALFRSAGEWAWIIAWAAVSLIQFLLIYLAPIAILPLFNKFTPLEEGELRDRLTEYAERLQFRLKGLFVMDGSRRSAHSNAFFTGFGRHRRIVLYDTMVEAHGPSEILAVLAHEMGHFKKKHIPWAVARAVLMSGIVFYLMSLCIDHPLLFEAFRMDQPSVYAGIVFFGFLFLPLEFAIRLLENAISRRHEFEADAFAAETTGEPDALIRALKKLSAENLSNLTPHPFTVLLEYSHPPLGRRIERLRA